MSVVELAHRARALIAAGSKGIIVSQGTDTLEEVAFGVSLLAPRGVPIVFTGAMRDSTQAGADGPANVLGAVRVAASGLTNSMGVVVVINDEIHDAVDVQKTHTTNPAAFRSPNLGPVGWTAVGLQIVGPWRRDDLVLAVGRALAAALPWESRQPDHLATGFKRQ